MQTSYDNDNIFAKILREEIPCITIFEDEHTLAFMDVMPQTDGHVLVISKEPASTLYELSDEAALACIKTVKNVGQAVQKAMKINGSTVFQHNGKDAGQTVPHFHIHVIPGSLFGIKGHAAEFADPEKLQAIAEKIIACL